MIEVGYFVVPKATPKTPHEGVQAIWPLLAVTLKRLRAPKNLSAVGIWAGVRESSMRAPVVMAEADDTARLEL